MSAERGRDTVGVVTELIEAFNVADWPRFRMTLDLHEDAATRRAKLERFLDEPAPPSGA